MKKKEFYEEVKNALQNKLGDMVQVQIKEVRKNNNVMLQGLIIQNPESNVAPTIYLNSFFEMYEKGYGMEQIVKRILQVYENGGGKNTINMEFFRDFQQVKDRIAYRLINAEKNKELLAEIPHILFLDLAICFYYAFSDEELGEGMILIYNNHMEMWNTSHQELLRLAQENTPRIFEARFITLDAVMNTLLGCEEKDVDSVGIYVLTNQSKNQGAACILYPEMLERIAKMLEGSFYVIPSSIHEVLLFKDDGTMDAKGLHEMIVEVNSSQLLTEEILSDYPYYYDKSEKKLQLIKGC